MGEKHFFDPPDTWEILILFCTKVSAKKFPSDFGFGEE
jgi:hypothetical protein